MDVDIHGMFVFVSPYVCQAEFCILRWVHCVYPAVMCASRFGGTIAAKPSGTGSTLVQNVCICMYVDIYLQHVLNVDIK